MFQFLGYSLLGDGTALDSAPSQVDNINSVKLSNAIFDNLTLDKSTGLVYSTDIPTTWTDTMVLNADMNGTLDAGNLTVALSNIASIKVRRRIVGEYGWITLGTIEINSDADNLNFVLQDYLNRQGVEYEYSFVPVDYQGNEGIGVTDTITSNFKGVFVADIDSMYRMFYDVSFGGINRNQRVGTFEPLGKKFPVVVANGLLNYDTGSFSVTVVNDGYATDYNFDRIATRVKVDNVKDFLTNHKPKIIKDENGNMWLVIVTGNPSVSYKQNLGGKLPNVSFEWTSVGDPDSQEDLYNNGFLDEVT